MGAQDHNKLTQFIKKLVESGTCHILIDELDLYNPSVLAEIQAINLNSSSLTIAIRGNYDVGDLKLNEGRTIVLNKIMRMSTQVYETITRPNFAPSKTMSKIYWKSTVYNILYLDENQKILMFQAQMRQ